MQVRNPRRILAVSLDGQADHLSRLIGECSSLAGTTQLLKLETRYYSAEVPIWLDLIASPSDWAGSFLSDEAREVLAVLGGVVLVFALPGQGQGQGQGQGAGGGASASASASASAAGEEVLRDLIGQVGRVVNEGLGGWEWDGVRLAVGVGVADADANADADADANADADADADADAEEWDELCAEAGMEFVRLGGSRTQAGRNEFGGIARVREALESNDWAQADAEDASSDPGDSKDGHGGIGPLGRGGDGDDEDEDERLDPDRLDFGFDAADMEGLKSAIWGASSAEGGGGG
ncbi:hypothetical protein E4U41_004543, partial [Claviceps citrina]